MFTLAQIAHRIGGTVVGDQSLEITGVGALASARTGQISHLSSAKYQKILPHTQASAVILREQQVDRCPTASVVVKNPSLSYATISHLFEKRCRTPVGVHRSSFVHDSSKIGENVRIGPFVNIGPNCEVGDDVEICGNVQIGPECVVGGRSVLFAGVVLYHDVRLGEGCTIHANSIIGADGFGLVPDEVGVLHPIAQLGGVRLGDNVLVGSGCTIDRGAIDHTVLETGVKLDDQVHIGHNCRVGAHSILCGCAGLAGSVTLGRHVVLGGGVGVAGDGPLRITDGVQVGSMTFVGRDITETGVYSGNVMHSPNAQWRRNIMRFNELDSMSKRLRALERRVRDLEAADDTSSGSVDE